MSINYSLQLEAKVQPTTLLSDINRTTEIPYGNYRQLKDELSHLIISAHTHDDKWNIESIEKEFGFTPFVWLAFIHGKTEHKRNNNLMMQTVTGMLKMFDGDMVFEYQSEIVILKRINGIITFNSDWDDMSGIEALTNAGLTHEMVKMGPQ